MTANSAMLFGIWPGALRAWRRRVARSVRNLQELAGTGENWKEDQMKIGVTAFLTEKSGNPGAIAAAAERAGFESFWVAEHPVIPAAYTTYYPRSPDGKVPEFYAHLADPFVALAAAAQATSHIRVGTSVCLLPERNPIETAKAAATLDMYSGGRLMLGVGAGWFPEEAAIMGVDRSESVV